MKKGVSSSGSSRSITEISKVETVVNSSKKIVLNGSKRFKNYQNMLAAMVKV